MPAGDLIDADWQMECQGYLIGAGTIWGNDSAGWTGIFGATVKTQDTPLPLAPGAVAATDSPDVRVITAAVTTAHSSNTVAECIEAMQDLEDAFAASPVDVELHLRLDGLGHVYFVGRPRGVVFDVSRLALGEASALCQFVALDPIAYPVPEPS